jgi:hypothetical protein
MPGRESDVQFLARGLHRALIGQGRAYTAEDFERLRALMDGENGKGVDRELGTNARPA